MTTEQIKKKFNGKLVGSSKMQKLVCQTLLIFPRKIINFVTENVWFISSFEDAWGFVLRMNELEKGKYLIFLSDELFDQSIFDQRYNIAHEVGHVILGHKNSLLTKQTKAEIEEQEREAHEFAIKYLETQ